jgi:mRNA-degrading endonuclease toxin of MazEF toxin-antitoxin module
MSVAVCDQLRAVDRSRLSRPSGALSHEDLRAVEAALRAVLQL